MKSLHADLSAYEDWLRDRCEVDESGLAEKHARMAGSPAAFLRGSYPRWARIVLDRLPHLRQSPVCLAVGDAHIENFGVWRDAEGRLAWGVNDFDDAAMMPALLDLVRLAVSVRVAGDIEIPRPGAATQAILDGYTRGLADPQPTVLHDRHLDLRKAITVSEKKRKAFWRRLDDVEPAVPPWRARNGLRYALPQGSTGEVYGAWRQGLGSLGRRRYLVLASWRGGPVVREAKVLVPSAWGWAQGGVQSRSEFMAAATGPHRCPDPILRVEHSYLIRRLAPDSRKIEFGDKGLEKLNGDLLDLMGAELAAIHAARPSAAPAILRDLATRPEAWLQDATDFMEQVVLEDFRAWTEDPRLPGRLTAPGA